MSIDESIKCDAYVEKQAKGTKAFIFPILEKAKTTLKEIERKDPFKVANTKLIGPVESLFKS